MGKIINTTGILDSSIFQKAKLDKNFVSDNYYIQTYQAKIDSDWDYKPNRIDLEEEIDEKNEESNPEGTLDFYPIEAVINSVYAERGKVLSDNWKRLIFKDMQYPRRLGKRFRFSINDFLETDDNNKSIWITTNYETVSFTCSVIIGRCSGTIGLLVEDNTQIWNEPCIIEANFKAINTAFNEVVNVPNAEIYVSVQFNKYTKLININDRFILGSVDFNNRDNNTAYKVKAINRLGALNTFEENSCSIILLALDRDVIDADDRIEIDSNTGIKYKIADYYKRFNPDKVNTKNYHIKVEPIVEKIYLNDTIEFECYLYNNKVKIDIPINVSTDLLQTTRDSFYYEFTQIDDNKFSIKNKKMYLKDKLSIKCYLDDTNEFTHKEISFSFDVDLGGEI
jgi:hypothetical protein